MRDIRKLARNALFEISKIHPSHFVGNTALTDALIDLNRALGEPHQPVVYIAKGDLQALLEGYRNWAEVARDNPRGTAIPLFPFYPPEQM